MPKKYYIFTCKPVQMVLFSQLNKRYISINIKFLMTVQISQICTVNSLFFGTQKQCLKCLSKFFNVFQEFFRVLYLNLYLLEKYDETQF